MDSLDHSNHSRFSAVLDAPAEVEARKAAIGCLRVMTRMSNEGQWTESCIGKTETRHSTTREAESLKGELSILEGLKTVGMKPYHLKLKFGARSSVSF